MWDVLLVQVPKSAVPVSIEQTRAAPSSAVKPKVGVLLFVRPDGPDVTETAGLVESEVYWIELSEHDELPAASNDLAESVVVAFAVTVTVIPKPVVKSDAEPVAATDPPQEPCL